MAKDRKQLLIVDDTEIDRIILKSILCKEFDILEANSGNVAFDYLTTRGDQLDGILLDIAMPHIDGFDVLRFMEEKNMTNIPVFLVSAEPTRDNVERAIKHNIAEFIGKPFDQEDVLRRVRSKLGVIPDYNLSNEDLKATENYITDLRILYNNYLTNFGKNDSHYKAMSALMQILLTSYSRTVRDVKLNPNSIDLISKAAYFCDIGEMFIPDKRLQVLSGFEAQDLQYAHSALGASLIRLNRAKSCEYFVEICSSMCLHHHERYDGQGYPDGLVGDNNSIYNQMCRLVDEFEGIRSKFYGDKARPVKFVVRRLVNDFQGLVAPPIYYLLEDCEQQIADYFMKADT